MDERIAVKFNRGMAEDALVGKARARVLKAFWRLVTNDVMHDLEPPDDVTTEAIIDNTDGPTVTHDPNDGGIDPLTQTGVL